MQKSQNMANPSMFPFPSRVHYLPVFIYSPENFLISNFNQRLLFARSWSVSCYSVTTQLLVDDLLVYNGTVNMALRTSSVSATCHTIVFTDVNQHDLTSTHTTAIMYASYCAPTTEPGLASFIGAKDDGSSGRSEEHTSELQSR